jgi:hypothetical protein
MWINISEFNEGAKPPYNRAYGTVILSSYSYLGSSMVRTNASYALNIGSIPILGSRIS